MWQSQAFAGALSVGASVPVELGTMCCALATVVPEASAAAPARNVRRSIIRRLPPGSRPAQPQLYRKCRGSGAAFAPSPAERRNTHALDDAAPFVGIAAHALAQ